MFCQLLILGTLLRVGLCGLGVETTVSLTADSIKCLTTNGYSFVMARIFTSQGKIDQSGYSIINTALANGFQAFSSFESCPGCSENASGQVTDTFEAADNNDISLGGIFIKVFTSLGGWSSNTATNTKYIGELISAIDQLGAIPVIYSSYSDWNTITGNDKEWTNSLRYVAYMHQDNTENEHDWVINQQQFGGWGLPYMKNYKKVSLTQCKQIINGAGLYAPSVSIPVGENRFSVKPLRDLRAIRKASVIV